MASPTRPSPSGPPRVARKVRDRVDTVALVVRRVSIGEADLMVTLLTRERGLVTASARGAKRPASKLGALEPMHTLRVVLEIAPSEEVGKLREARIERARLGLLSEERRMNAAGALLRLARRTTGPVDADPDAFDAVEAGLDAIAAAEPGRARGSFAWAGARLLQALGYGIELSRCVRCGTPCPPSSPSFVDPVAGGLVCRACGGGPILLSAEQRRMLAAWLEDGAVALEPRDEDAAIAIVERAAEAR